MADQDLIGAALMMAIGLVLIVSLALVWSVRFSAFTWDPSSS